MKYTVVGYFADNNQSYVEWVEVDHLIDAKAAALKNLDDYEKGQLQIVVIFEGHLLAVDGGDTF